LLLSTVLNLNASITNESSSELRTSRNITQF
jgi:hypothetical protein